MVESPIGVEDLPRKACADLLLLGGLRLGLSCGNLGGRGVEGELGLGVLSSWSGWVRRQRRRWREI